MARQSPYTFFPQTMKTASLSANPCPRRQGTWSLWLVCVLAILCWLGSPDGGFGAIRVWLNNYQANWPIIDWDHLAFGDDVHVEVMAGPVGGMLLPVLIATNRTGLIKFNETSNLKPGLIYHKSEAVALERQPRPDT